MPWEIEHRNRVLARQPDRPIWGYHHAAILDALGRRDEARSAVQAALQPGADFCGSAAARALALRLANGVPGAP